MMRTRHCVFFYYRPFFFGHYHLSDESSDDSFASIHRRPVHAAPTYLTRLGCLSGCHIAQEEEEEEDVCASENSFEALDNICKGLAPAFRFALNVGLFLDPLAGSFAIKCRLSVAYHPYKNLVAVSKDD